MSSINAQRGTAMKENDARTDAESQEVPPTPSDQPIQQKALLKKNTSICTGTFVPRPQGFSKRNLFFC
jgi:hypothetical protein